MIIEIDDKLKGKERFQRVEILMTQYALDLFTYDKEKAASWLGVSVRTLRNRFQRYPELSSQIRNKVVIDPEISISLQEDYQKYLSTQTSRPGFISADDKERINLLKRFKEDFLKGLEQ